MAKPRCFIIQQYVEDDFDSLYDVIETAAELANYEIKRADKELGARPPMEKIISLINDSDVCIAEANTDNPNVYFEMGYAIALGKPLFILWDKKIKAKLPFDVSHRAALTYNSSEKDWSKKLRSSIKENLLHESNDLKPANVSNAVPKDSALDELSVKILTVLALAKANNQKIGILGMPELFKTLGIDSLEITLCINQLKLEGYLDRTLNMRGDVVCNYYIQPKGLNYLQDHSEELAKLRASLPNNFSGYGPASASRTVRRI